MDSSTGKFINFTVFSWLLANTIFFCSTFLFVQGNGDNMVEGVLTSQLERESTYFTIQTKINNNGAWTIDEDISIYRESSLKYTIAKDNFATSDNPKYLSCEYCTCQDCEGATDNDAKATTRGNLGTMSGALDIAVEEVASMKITMRKSAGCPTSDRPEVPDGVNSDGQQLDANGKITSWKNLPATTDCPAWFLATRIATGGATGGDNAGSLEWRHNSVSHHRPGEDQQVYHEVCAFFRSGCVSFFFFGFYRMALLLL